MIRPYSMLLISSTAEDSPTVNYSSSVTIVVWLHRLPHASRIPRTRNAFARLFMAGMKLV
jgi:hypothetical protein